MSICNKQTEQDCERHPPGAQLPRLMASEMRRAVSKQLFQSSRCMLRERAHVHLLQQLIFSAFDINKHKTNNKVQYVPTNPAANARAIPDSPKETS